MTALNVISLGGGVQSTALCLMAAHGKIEPMPDAAIFADTQWEPRAVYDHTAWLSSANVLPFPIFTVTAGNLRDDILAVCDGRADRVSNAPFFTLGRDGKAAPIGRNCTRDYKIAPVRRRLREILGRHPKPSDVSLWIGISSDEKERMSVSPVKWIDHRWPLVELDMSRGECIAWMTQHGYPIPPKSACIGCPFRSDFSWQDMRRTAPEEFRDACEIDGAIKMLPTDNPAYIHRSLRPLGAANFNNQGELIECTGTCMT